MDLYDFLGTSQEPLLEIHSWIQEANEASVGLPHAMNLATVDSNGQPSSRMVLLKSLSDTGLVFFTDYEGKKGQEIINNKKAALNFWWAKTNKQIRIEGNCEKVSKQESDDYFQLRPRISQISAKASHQSKEIETYEGLAKIVDEIKNSNEGKKLERPERWGGFILKPELIEFWIDQKDRLHRRKLYKLVDKKWKISLLAP
ncbi:MAG TPA: pyridoxamine 5'-phosphate oxidase [Gammaproteobacteria bacterium]|nr:pyridoxamine 5'-phosphate oxidase [Gammaproteobacteria bacterium]